MYTYECLCYRPYRNCQEAKCIQDLHFLLEIESPLSCFGCAFLPFSDVFSRSISHAIIWRWNWLLFISAISRGLLKQRKDSRPNESEVVTKFFTFSQKAFSISFSCVRSWTRRAIISFFFSRKRNIQFRFGKALSENSRDRNSMLSCNFRAVFR